MYELVEYLSKGPCLVIVGAGASSEIGLPDWQGLAEEVLTALRTVAPKDLEEAELDFARNGERGADSSGIGTVMKKVGLKKGLLPAF